ncbi:acetyl-CoA carboxylase biotin carboxyl carrier protein [Thermoflexales bacterium]|nr:acetyl-CoA carboxylase biotin carboxyl carrier protein [Thermoflexales bacterium]
MKLIVKVENQSFEVEVGDIHARPIIATIAGEAFEVWPEDVQLVRSTVQVGQVASLPTVAASVPRPATAHSAPKSSTPTASTVGAKSVLAPLPGVIVAVNAKPGDAVESGQELCIIEAMKMKNVIRANRSGTIEAVHITVNQHVKHHDVLLEFTD